MCYFLVGLNAGLNTGVFGFVCRFGTDMQMVNLSTGEFQLTKACPYQVGGHFQTLRTPTAGNSCPSHLMFWCLCFLLWVKRM